MNPTTIDTSGIEGNQSAQIADQHIAEQDGIDVGPYETPTRPTPRSGKKGGAGTNGKKMTPSGGKWKRRLHRNEGIEGECHLLNLPVDVLHLLLSRLPPRSLKALSLTCKTLREDLAEESIWRESYANRFIWDGAARSRSGKEDLRVLVQGCMGDIGRGWRKESLNREAMLDRWIGSKQNMVVHHPPLGLIHSLSLSYPTYSPPAPRSLVVGKTHQTPSKAGPSSTPSSTPSVNGDEPATPTPSKLTHRQKYEQLIAATTRPAPYVLSASLFLGSIVRSDPLSGKASKGFWGPGRDANFHLRPHLDQSAEPSAIYLPARSQTQALWGLVNGSCVHTTLASKSQSSQGGRATSINVLSVVSDAHEGEICDIWMDDSPPDSASVRWVTGGTDGRVKYWQLNPSEGRSGKRSPAGDVPASITCLFTSPAVTESFPNRSENVKRRQSGKPDDVTIVRCDSNCRIICGVTEDGDLRVWFDVGNGNEREVRVDVGSAEEMGVVKVMELDAISESQASILIHHHRSSSFARYDIDVTPGQDADVRCRPFKSPVPGAFSTIHASLRPAPPISIRSVAPPVLSTPADSDANDSQDSPTTSPSLTPVDSPSTSEGPVYGRFVVTGDEHGVACIWKWDTDTDGDIKPLRAWPAMNGRITAIDANCGLVAVGSFDGFIKVYDPLSSPPTLLRSFHASHLSSADAYVAASHEPDARYFNVNQIILENDLVVASIGRKVFAWKAGTGKGRTKVDSHRRASGQKTESKGTLKPLDKKALKQESLDTQAEIRSTPPPIRQSNYERAQFAAMDDLGLEDGDDALQYALMLSMDEEAHQGSSAELSDSVADGDDAELQEMLEMIRLAEERERQET